MNPTRSISSQLAPVLAVLASMGASTGCEAPPATAPRSNVEAVRYRSFAPEDVRFNDVKFFLWRESMTADDVVTATRVADEMELREREGFLAQQERDVLRAEHPEMADWLALHDEWDYLVEDELVRREREKTEEEAKPEGQRDPEAIRWLSEEIARIRSDAQAIEGKMSEVGNPIDPPGEGAAQGSFRLRYLDAYRRRLEASKRGEALVREIQGAVEWYLNQPSRVSFAFLPGGRIEAKIIEWNLNDGMGKRDFSTENGSIRNVQYAELGGRFTFDVYVLDGERVREIYSFKLSRARYEDGDRDHRKYMAGSLKKKDAEGRVLREGAVKLIDKKYGE